MAVALDFVKDTIVNASLPELNSARATSEPASSQFCAGTGDRPSLAEFLRMLFEALEQERVRYCVLHGWDNLPNELESDRNLDLAVHPRDAKKLSPVFRVLGEGGYWPIQLFQYSVHACAYVFAWFEGLALKTVTVEFAFEHRELGFVWKSGAALVNGRRNMGAFWAASPDAEFAYLLVKRISQRAMREFDQPRLQFLVETLTPQRAEKITSELFGRRRAVTIVQACLDGSLSHRAQALRLASLRRHLLLRPLNAASCFMGDTLRLFRRWLRPTGLCIILLGPDGVGKSTLVAGLSATFDPAFRRRQVFHWRPGVALPIRGGDGSLSNPHEEPARGAIVSVFFLFGFFLDFCLGYVLRIRPLLAQSGLVFFDRYFPDLMVDRKRYRYSGPAWLVQLLWKLLPRSDDLVIVLTAAEQVILSRKQQLPLEELRRQLADYRRLSEVFPIVHLVATDPGVEQTLAATARVVFQHLANRFREQNAAFGRVNVPRTSVGVS